MCQYTYVKKQSPCPVYRFRDLWCVLARLELLKYISVSWMLILKCVWVPYIIKLRFNSECTGKCLFGCDATYHHHHHHHHHISVMELRHLLTRSSFTHPEVSSKVCHDSFCQLGNIVSLPWVIYYDAFYLHVVSSFSYIPVICPKLVLLLIPLQFVYKQI